MSHNVSYRKQKAAQKAKQINDLYELHKNIIPHKMTRQILENGMGDVTKFECIYLHLNNLLSVFSFKEIETVFDFIKHEKNKNAHNNNK